MDIPIGDLQWEVFLPERYKVKDFGGDPASESLLPRSYQDAVEEPINNTRLLQLPMLALNRVEYSEPIGPGQVGGIIIDPAGAVVTGATVSVDHLGTSVNLKAVSDSKGRWMVPNVPSGRVRITVDVAGFRKLVQEVTHDASRGTRLSLAIQVGSVSESVTVSANAPLLSTASSEVSRNSYNAAPVFNPPQPASANVTDLQRRVAGVLPIAVNVPRMGSSYRFVRPLVIDEETKLTFKYRSR
jgi:carboxypeptidase family protein